MQYTRGADTGSFIDDAGPTSGSQAITLNSAHAMTLLVGTTAYIQGDAMAVTSFFGFPATQASRLANHWISLTSADSGYTNVVEGVTLASALQEEALTAPMTLGAVTSISGQQATPINGALTNSENSGQGTGTMYVSTGANPLPIQFVSNSPQGSEKVTFTKWGVAVALTAPTGAIPVASIPSA